jgi:hypothetical protein
MTYPLVPIGNPVPVNQGGTGAVTAVAAMTALGGMSIVATTGLAGFALQNATPTILSWIVPNDGNMHRYAIFGGQFVTVAETGGAVSTTFTDPIPTTRTRQLFAGGSGLGYTPIITTNFLIAPNQTVTIAQTSALTAGTATVWFEIWGL